MGSSLIAIRPIEADDIDECIALGVDAFVPVHASLEERYGTDLFNRLRPDWRDSQAGAIDYLCNAKGKKGLVVVRNQSVLGFIVATAAPETGLASIDMVSVRRTEQRRGLGTRLIGESLAGLRDNGMVYAQAYLRDFAGHKPARIAFGKAGFRSMPMHPMPLYTRLDHETPSSAGSTDIRRIREADIAECVQFGVESFRSVFASFREQHGEDVFPRMFPNWEEAQAEHIESVCRSSDKETWVYESHGAVSGFVVMSTTNQLLGEIELLAVDPRAQGHGIGTALNQKALDRLRDTGMVYAVVATASDPGHAAARRTYEKAGFAPMPVQWDFVITKL